MPHLAILDRLSRCVLLRTRSPADLVFLFVTVRSSRTPKLPTRRHRPRRRPRLRPPVCRSSRVSFKQPRILQRRPLWPSGTSRTHAVRCPRNRSPDTPADTPGQIRRVYAVSSPLESVLRRIPSGLAISARDADLLQVPGITRHASGISTPAYAAPEGFRNGRG